ncbi:GHKL domain-containing protein [Pseudomonas cavernae]|uniref:histidine kinase n=1 Tax=Pseudomonas cavernae TaxID=2320867 RepID=A0A385Z182_9PSED|nr:ATP-binding protein [Pseudomonas cavernae]AYC32959.1 GHKL domain-containing protein [Pseudomonas cavernae]
MQMAAGPKPFNLFRWFSLASLFIIVAVAIALAVAATRFVMTESVDRDAMLSAQFIQSIADVEILHAHFPPSLKMGEFLDARVDGAQFGIPNDQLARVRREFFDHITRMPDVLLASVYAADGVIIWSTNANMIGQRVLENDDLSEAFRSNKTVTTFRRKAHGGPIEGQFQRSPRGQYIENYIPLVDSTGKVACVIEIYKEPQDLITRMNRGYMLLWLATAIGGTVIYVSLFWIVRHASGLLASQQRKLIDNETLVVLGEMSSAVAHGLRNPLASIRSSAELALDADSPSVHKNLDDIITQVDRLSKWVRELLLSSRPLSDEYEKVNLVEAVHEALTTYEQQIRRAGIQVDWTPEPAPAVVSHPVLLSQLLSSVLSNAIEAMPKGGRLNLTLDADKRKQHLILTVSDSGSGMSPALLEKAFKPFHTTKRGGIGVGLVLVRRIVERFGGEVHIESRENLGTDVHLTFRVAGGG